MLWEGEGDIWFTLSLLLVLGTFALLFQSQVKRHFHQIDQLLKNWLRHYYNCFLGYRIWLLVCPVIQKFVPELAEQQFNYSDIFGVVDDQLRIVKIYSEISRQRDILLESLSLK